MVVDTRQLVQFIDEGFPALIPEEAGDVMLAGSLGPAWRHIFRWYPYQIPDDFDQPITVLIHVASKLVLDERERIHQSSEVSSNCLGRFLKPELTEQGRGRPVQAMQTRPASLSRSDSSRHRCKPAHQPRER